MNRYTPLDGVALFAIAWALGIAAASTPQQGFADKQIVTVTSETRERYELSSFYKKMVVTDGIPIFSSDRPADAALVEAKRLVDQMLAGRPRLVDAMLAANLRITVMAADEFTTDVPEHSHLTPKAYWDRRARGLGGTIEIPVVSCGEENLLRYEGDPYYAENILLHEFAHSVHLVGMARLSPDFDAKLKEAYEAAKSADLWKATYAMSNAEEYFAEGSQTWFECNNDSGPIHSKVKTREDLRQYDPKLAKLLEIAYGNNDWRFRRDRKPPGAISKAKQFSWQGR